MAAPLLSTHALHQGRRATVYKRPGRHFLHMCGHLGSGSRRFCVYSSTGVLSPTFLGEKSLALNPSLKKTWHCIRTLWASSSCICPLCVIIVDANLPGQRGGCHLACLCITDDTLGHNQWPNDNYDPTVLRACFASTHSTNPVGQFETKVLGLDIGSVLCSLKMQRRVV